MPKLWPCPRCGYDDWLLSETRITQRGVRRRRYCSECNHGVSTLEVSLEDVANQEQEIKRLKKISEQVSAFIEQLTEEQRHA